METITKTKWSLDISHSDISFKIRHLMIAHVKGTFKNFEASIYTEGLDFSSAQIDLWIDASSISTGDINRDEHLKGEEFFNIKKHKQINITASVLPKLKPNETSEIWVELSMLGITKNVCLEIIFGGIAKDPYGKEKAGFALNGIIKRSDWGLVWNSNVETGGVLISDDVYISAELELLNMGEHIPNMILKTNKN